MSNTKGVGRNVRKSAENKPHVSTWRTSSRCVLTVKAVVDVHAVAVVQTLQRARQINVEVEVRRVLLLADARQVSEEILVHVRRERLGCEQFVADRCVER